MELDPARYIHTIQLNPTKILLYFRALAEGNLSCHKGYMDQIMTLSSGILFNKASLQDIANYARSKRGQQSFAWTPPQQGYHLKADDFYALTSQDIFPALEIHDAVVHPAQFRTWPGFYYPLVELATLARKELPRRHRFSRFLDYSFFAAAEYGVTGSTVETAAPLGCLLYTYTRKNPMRGTDITMMDSPEKLLTKWEALRASSSLFRRNNNHERNVGEAINWYFDFGYLLPRSLYPYFSPLARRYIEPLSEIKDPCEEVDLSEISYPPTIEDLMNRILEIMKLEFLNIDNLSSSSRNKIRDIMDRIIIC